MDYAGRIAKLRAKMEKRGLAAVFTGSDSSWEYFTGAKRISRGPTPYRQSSLEWAGLLVTEKDVILFIPRLTGMSILPFLPQDTVITGQVAFADSDLDGREFIDELRRLGLADRRLGVNRDVSASAVLSMEERLDIKTEDASDIIDGLRAVKDAEEIALMRENSRIADRVFEKIMGEVRPGVSTRLLEREIERLFEEEGCSQPSFHAEAVSMGPKSGPIFGMNHDKVEKGHVLSFDFGGCFQGYCSDFGRTIFIGEPEPELLACHRLVMDSQRAGIEALRAGRPAWEANRASRQVIEEAGYGAYYLHRLGHGIGKDVHERPFLCEGEETVLQAGMLFTAEPSLILIRRGWIRVEDVILVTENGGECLGQATKEPIIVE